MKKYKYTILYSVLVIGTGVWQLLDWYFGSEDPIWHLFFYVPVIPALSFAYVIVQEELKWWAAPLLATGLTLFVYLFMANGGRQPSLDGAAFQLTAPAFLAAFMGALLRRLFEYISNKKRGER